MINYSNPESHGVGATDYPGTSYMVEAPDGARISAYTLGPDYGVPIVIIGGRPSSKEELFVTQHDLEELSVRAISFDRRGYGDSDCPPDSYVEDAAGDVRAVVKGVSRFGIVARSGGVPAALAVATLYPDEVSGMVLMGGTAQPDASNDLHNGVIALNRKDIHNATHNPVAAASDIHARAENINEQPDFLYQDLTRNFQGGDYLISIICGYPSRIIRGHATAIGDGSGWLNDLLAGEKPWTRQGPLDLSRITAPTVILHGDQDRYVSPRHADVLASLIPKANLVPIKGGTHLELGLYTCKALAAVRDYHLGSAVTDWAAELAEVRWQEQQRFLENPPPGLAGFEDLDERFPPQVVARMIGEHIITKVMMYDDVIREILQGRTPYV